MKKPLFNDEYIAFSPFDRIALAQLIRRIIRPGCRVAEIGSWLGTGSTQVFLRELSHTPGSGLLCVDHWKGNSNVKRHQDIVAKFDVLATFLSNVEAVDSPVGVQTMVSPSIYAASVIADAAFDLVFIDADHTHEAVKGDIAVWLTKVRPGGILCGHDCEARVTEQNRGRLLASATADVIKGDGTPFPEIHPGSVLAVDEAFGSAAELWAERELVTPDGRSGRSTIWSFSVPG